MSSRDTTSDYLRPTIATIEGQTVVDALGPAAAYGAPTREASEFRRFVRKGDLFR